MFFVSKNTIELIKANAKNDYRLSILTSVLTQDFGTNEISTIKDGDMLTLYGVPPERIGHAVETNIINVKKQYANMNGKLGRISGFVYTVAEDGNMSAKLDVSVNDDWYRAIKEIPPEKLVCILTRVEFEDMSAGWVLFGPIEVRNVPKQEKALLEQELGYRLD